MRVLNEKIEKMLKESIHSVEIECGKASSKEIELAKKDAYGEISEKDFFKEALNLIKE